MIAPHIQTQGIALSGYIRMVLHNLPITPHLQTQGMTLDCVEISLGRAFEDGQAYVALSRARSLQSLRVKDFNPTCVHAHPDVLDYYRGLRRMRRNYIEDRAESWEN